MGLLKFVLQAKQVVKSKQPVQKPVPSSVFKKVKNEYAKYGIDENTTVADLQEELMGVCYNVASTKNAFIKCLDEGAKMTRRKIQQLRKTVFADRLNDPVDDDIVQELIDELNAVKAPDGSGLGDIKQKLILACAEVSQNVDDLLVCVDEGEKIPIIINKDLAKLL